MRLSASLISWCTGFCPLLFFSRGIFFEPELDSVVMPKRVVDPAVESRKTLCTFLSFSSGRACRSF
jgi:hypothetical protein